MGWPVGRCKAPGFQCGAHDLYAFEDHLGNVFVAMKLGATNDVVVEDENIHDRFSISLIPFGYSAWRVHMH